MCSSDLFEFTTNLEDFIAHSGPKMSYGKAPLGNEFFVQSHKLLFSQGLEDWEIHVRPWDESVGFFASGDIGKMPYDIFAASFYLLSRYGSTFLMSKTNLDVFLIQRVWPGNMGFWTSLLWIYGPISFGSNYTATSRNSKELNQKAKTSSLLSQNDPSNF